MIPFYAKLETIPEDIIYSNPQRKEELIKLMIKTMENLGFENSAKSLEEESNIKIARTIDNDFSEKFFRKKWDEVIEIVERIDIYEDSKKNIKFF